MKHLYITAFLFLTSYLLTAQQFAGDWSGHLQVPGAKMKIVFHIVKSGDSYSTTMDSPDQMASGIPVENTQVKKDSIILTIANPPIQVKGKWKEPDKIVMIFNQNGMQLPLELERARKEAIQPPERPQEVKEPFSYRTEEVQFLNTIDNTTLAGTLSIPKDRKDFPVVILLSGSGPQNRNSEVFGHKPFLVLADHLTKNGIAVLRYDDRGIAASTGDYTSATAEDFKNDAEAAVEFLQTRKDITSSRIGLLGHSEGGLVASMLAADNSDIAYIVLLAAPGVPGDVLMLEQHDAIHKSMGLEKESYGGTQKLIKEAYNLIKTIPDNQLNSELAELIKSYGISGKAQIEQLMAPFKSPEFKFLIRSNPSEYLSKIDCPLLALNGSNDLQVRPSSNLKGIKNALNANTNVTIKEMEGLNHLFQRDSTGLPQNYKTISETFAPEALEVISSWILKLKL